MDINKNIDKIEELGKEIGYIFGYFLFTTVLYLILILLKKIPESWNYLYIMGIVLLIVIIGTLLKKWLK